jgi:hypothetical protein
VGDIERDCRALFDRLAPHLPVPNALIDFAWLGPGQVGGVVIIIRSSVKTSPALRIQAERNRFPREALDLVWYAIIPVISEGLITAGAAD